LDGYLGKGEGMTNVAALLLLALVMPVTQAPPAPPTRGADLASQAWVAFKPLVGRWVGEGVGFGASSSVEHEWAFVVQGNFLELRTRSRQRAEADAPGEVHEDMGLLSRDTDRGTFVFRQFLSEGFVNTYDVIVQPDSRPHVLFRHRESESSGGMRAQMRLTFNGADEYEMTLDLAMPGNEFKPCQRMLMRRVR
jgi:hypothetical protein